MDTRTVELVLSDQQYQKLVEFAESQNLDVEQAARRALGEWLENQYKLAHGREVMRNFHRLPLS